MGDLVKESLTFRKHWPPELLAASTRDLKLVGEQPDHSLEGDAPAGEVEPTERTARRQTVVLEPTPDLKMGRRVGISRQPAVVLPEDPAITALV